jgi:hypothetical protein
MRLALAFAALISGVFVLVNALGEKGRTPIAVHKMAQDKANLTGKISEIATTEGAHVPTVAVGEAERESEAEGAIALEHKFETAGSLTANEKAALIDAAVSFDDPRLLGLAETLALKMLNDGGAAEVLAVLPKVPLFAENSRLHSIAQESICRFSGFPLQVVKLKFDRVFPPSRPWATVCKTS